MSITLTALSAGSGLTYSTLKQYAKDQLQDKNDEKGLRRAGRVVNDGLRMLAAEKLWTWHRIRHRIVLRPRLTYTSVCTMAAEGDELTLATGSFPTNATRCTFYFSGTTQAMRVAVRDSAKKLTMFSTDVYVASAGKTNKTGFLAYDRHPLPENFRALWTDPQQRDRPHGLYFVDPDEFAIRKNGTAPGTGGTTFYTLETNPHTRTYELAFWPEPNELRSADLYIYVWPLELTNDSDVAMWDPSSDYALFAAIDLQIAKELKDTDRYPMMERAYRAAVQRAKSEDLKLLVDNAATGREYHGSKIYRSKGFTDA